MRGDTGFPIRIRFAKRGKIRFISHRDVARTFERAFRIEALPLAFTLGFSPRPKVSFGLALSVGHESIAEYLDLELAHELDWAELPAPLTAALPEGLEVTGVTALAERAPALQEAVTAVEYHLEVVAAEGASGPNPAAVSASIEALMAATEYKVPRIRKGREMIDDIRPALQRLDVIDRTMRGVLVRAELGTQPVNVRPKEIVAALGESFSEGLVLRTHQWIERGGARLEPLEADRRSRVPEACAP